MKVDRKNGRQSGIYARVAAAMASLSLIGAPAATHAVTLGGYEVQSALGQTLRLVIQVAARPDEELDANCFRINPFSVAGDGLPQLTAAQVRLERRATDQRLIITSARAITDPIVRVAIDVGCDTTLRREITLLLDPPTGIETLPQVAETRPGGVAIPAPERAPPSSPSSPAASAAARSSGPATGTARAGADAMAPGAGDGSSAAGRASSAATPTPAGRPFPRSQTVGPVAQVDGTPRPPRALPQAGSGPQAARQPPPLPRPSRAPRDRLTISASPLPLESSGATLIPQLNLATTLGDRNRGKLSDNALSLLRQKQARLRAAPAGEDLPSLEAELVVLQKRTAEMQRQLDSVMSQMAAMRGVPPPPSSFGSVTPPLPTPAPAATPAAPGVAPTIPANADVVQATTPQSPIEYSPGGSWSSVFTDSRLMVALVLGLVLLFLILGFFLWLRRERHDERRAERWNLSAVNPGGAAQAAKTTSFDRNLRDEPPAPGAANVSPAAAGVAGVAATGIAAVAAARGAPELKLEQPDGYQFKTYAGNRAAQDLGVSDLAQATEKASVFVTLGRPAQAIDVLRDHIDHEPKSSPMAWLMLLDLYRQTKRNDDFNEVAERFHLEYNAVTPEWSHPVAPLHDTGLAAFPYLVARIRDSWPTIEARSFIEGLLYDNRGGSRIGFSIPAFRDLLLLHSMIDEHLAAMDKHGRIDPINGRILDAPGEPDPPEHLVTIWRTASAERPVYTTPLPADLVSMPAGMVSMHESMFEQELQPIPEPKTDVKHQLKPETRVERQRVNLPPFDVNAIANSADRSSLEKNFPIIAEALVSRWSQPGLADYLSNLIRSSSDREAGLTNEALGELILLHDLALEMGDPEPNFSMA